jgi:hypothetical protein
MSRHSMQDPCASVGVQQRVFSSFLRESHPTSFLSKFRYKLTYVYVTVSHFSDTHSHCEHARSFTPVPAFHTPGHRFCQ